MKARRMQTSRDGRRGRDGWVIPAAALALSTVGCAAYRPFAPESSTVSPPASVAGVKVDPAVRPSAAERPDDPTDPLPVEGRVPATDPPAAGGIPAPVLPNAEGAAPTADLPAAIPTAAAAGVPPPVPTPPVVPPPSSVFPVDLTTALRLAEVENPTIAEARARVGEALALQQGAKALLLPTLNIGFNYHGHTGDLQRSTGRILSLSEQSLYVGGGARSLAAESVSIPAVRIFSPLTDAIYEPLAARQQVEVFRYDSSATANTILLEVATHYLELAGAEARLEALQQSVAEASEVARLTAAYARVGLAKKSDADRAATELGLRQGESQHAEEDVAVASTRLARRVHLDPSVRIRPVGGPIAPITLIDPDANVEELIQAALRRRPEMGSRGAAISRARVRLRQEMARPLLPTLSVGFSGAGFGGGSNLEPPLLGRFGGRTDFDVLAYWSLQNFGVGNLAIQRGRRVAIGEAESQRARTINLVRRQVTEALALANARRRQVEVTRRELETAEAGFREDLTRTRGAVGLPIEVVNSLNLLARARQDYIREVVGYDQAQFRLFVAMGSPPPLGSSASAPLPPAPIAFPSLRPPLPG